jgi:transcriptional regulator with XRE-family HTH domain
MNAVAQHFGETLRRLRIDADLSQEQLGHRASLHRTEIGLLERGARVPRIDTLVKLAMGLGIPPETLLAGITWEPGGVTRGAFRIDEADQSGATADQAAARSE